MFGFLFIIVVSLSSLPLTNAAKKDIQVPFVGKVGGWGLSFQLTVGTPPQLAEVLLDNGAFSSIGLELSDARHNDDINSFDPTKSTTFVNVSQNEWDWRKTNATESFGLNGITLAQKPLIVNGNYQGGNYARLGIGRYNQVQDYDCPRERNGDCTSFIQSVVRDFPSQVLVIAVDEIKNLAEDGSLISGRLAFGNKATNLCKKNWVYRPEVENPVVEGLSWTFDVDSLNVGSYEYSYKTQAVIDGFSQILSLPNFAYKQILKALGATNYRVPCNSTQTLDLKLGRRQLTVGPEIFTNKDTADVDGKCQLRLGTNDQFIQIPFKAFGGQCILYDYKNLRLGFADRV